jgi:hypothetical protein
VKPRTYDEAVREKQRMISLVRAVPLRAEFTDDEIWAHWKDLLSRRPTSAFECCRSLNLLATCDQLAAAGVPDDVLQPVRDHALFRTDPNDPSPSDTEKR